MGIRTSLSSLVSRPMEGAIRDMIEEVLASRSFVRPGEVAGLRQEIASLKAGGTADLEERIDALEARLAALQQSLDQARAARPAAAAAGDRGCVVDGCDRKHRARSFCAKHYQMFRRSTLPGVVGPDGVVPFEGAPSWTVDPGLAGKAAAIVDGVIVVAGEAVEAVQSEDCVLAALALLLVTSAQARDAVELEVVRKAQHGFGSPSITVIANAAVHIDLTATCSGQRYTLSQDASPGTSWPLALEGLALGAHKCVGTLAIRAGDGSAGELPFDVEVELLPPLELAVPEEELDLEGQRLVLHAARPLSRVAVEVIDDRGQQVGSAELEVSGLDVVEVPWHGTPGGEVLKIVVVAEDQDHLPGRLELSPWHYSIPHEDVVFESGRWDVLPVEEPKLEHSWSELQQVLARYGEIVEVKLYVAGYTDTVGGTDSNQALSTQRARAIARWFRARGFRGPVAYQGFGEAVLAVPTPDETDERANRRALYVLAGDAPPTSEELPGTSWVRLP